MYKLLSQIACIQNQRCITDVFIHKHNWLKCKAVHKSKLCTLLSCSQRTICFLLLLSNTEHVWSVFFLSSCFQFRASVFSWKKSELCKILDILQLGMVIEHQFQLRISNIQLKESIWLINSLINSFHYWSGRQPRKHHQNFTFSWPNSN